jgi:hypothetical protein
MEHETFYSTVAQVEMVLLVVLGIETRFSGSLSGQLRTSAIAVAILATLAVAASVIALGGESDPDWLRVALVANLCGNLAEALALGLKQVRR